MIAGLQVGSSPLRNRPWRSEGGELRFGRGGIRPYSGDLAHCYLWASRAAGAWAMTVRFGPLTREVSMSQQIRRVFVALGLMATLFLAAPSPSHAAGFRNSFLDKGFAGRIWEWLESLVPRMATPSSMTGRTVSAYEKEGSGIDPNGGTRPPGMSAPTSITNSDEGSAIDPNGK